MGYLQAVAMAEATDERTALVWHLTANHYPPVPAEMVDVCVNALDAVTERGDTEEWVELPDWVAWKGSTHAPAWAVMENFHLWPFADERTKGRATYETP